MPEQSANQQASIIYETVKLSTQQIAELNANYRALGLPIVVVDISQFASKLERQPDGTWERKQIRVPKEQAANDAGTEQPK